MYITNKHISRRTILRGMGAAVSLPLLEAMVPARSAFGKPTADPARLVCIEMVHGSAGSTKYGIEKNLWAPAAEGSAFDLTPSSLSPLEPFRVAKGFTSHQRMFVFGREEDFLMGRPDE